MTLRIFDQALVASTNGRIRNARPLDRIARVSVVIPCYNYGRYLKECVASVTQNQPGVEVEVIIVDDKSTDDSVLIARSIQASDSRIRLIEHIQNAGHIATYNDGLQTATGEYILLLSADDLVTPGALTRAAELLSAEPSVGLVYGNAIPFTGSAPPSRRDRKKWIIWSGPDWLRDRCKSGYNVASSPEVVMRASVLQAIGGYRSDLPHAGDFEMWMRASAVACVGFVMGVDQAYYRKHNTNMHKKDFRSGTSRGGFVDLEQRWRSFEAVLTGVGSRLADCEELLQTARETMARQALECTNYAYARGFHDFPFKEFDDLAREIHGDVASTRTGRASARRKRFGILPFPLHPLWAAPALIWRLEEGIRRWRRYRIGV